VRYHVSVGDDSFEVEVDHEGVSVDGERITVCGPEQAGPNLYSFLVGGASHTVLAERAGPGVWDLQLRGRRVAVEVVDDRTKLMRDMASRGSALKGPAPIRAPMPGLVLKVEVEKGERVRAGDGLLVVEAMKMENLLTATVGGHIGTVHVVAGQTVEKNEILIDMLPAETELP